MWYEVQLFLSKNLCPTLEELSVMISLVAEEVCGQALENLKFDQIKVLTN